MYLKKCMFIFSIMIFLFNTADAIDFSNLMEGNPVITISNDENGKLKSVTAYSITNAPLEILWDTILDIKSYKEFTPGIRDIKNIIKNEKGNEITADFEIEVPFSNLKYNLVYRYDLKARTIEVRRKSGDLEGSHWLWKFEKLGENTLIVYSGLIKNFSFFLESFDDSSNSMATGINVSTILSTVKINKERAEFLYNKSKAEKNAASK